MKFCTWVRRSGMSVFVTIVLSIPMIAEAGTIITETRTTNGVSGAYCESIPDNVVIKELAVQWVFGYLSAMSTLENSSYSRNLLKTKTDFIRNQIVTSCRINPAITISKIAFQMYQQLGGVYYRS